MIENLLYTALASLLVVVLLHIGVFWVSRVIQPPKPRVVYMQSPPAQYNTLAQPQPQQPQVILPPQALPPQALPIPAAVAPLAPTPEIKLPTYDSPPPPPQKPSLPPPIETRESGRS
jgi:hypothetical protein